MTPRRLVEPSAPTPSGNGAVWDRRIRAGIESLLEAHRWRSPRVFDARGVEGVLQPEGVRLVSFATNDYLGLSTHPAVVAAAHEALDRWGTGSGASRLVSGTRPVHAALEAEIARWKGCQRAACLPTGFAANLAALGALGGPGTRVLSDELNHASIVDGCRLSRSHVTVYRHGDPTHVDALLAECREAAIVVTDSVFSMDGDLAPLAALAECCRRHGALLVIDEAHAVLGPHLGPEVTEDLAVVRVGTMSKTLGSLGGFVAGPQAIVELVENLARSYIFTTAASPADAAAALAALDVLGSPEGDALIATLRGHVTLLAPAGVSPIVPVVLGSEASALAASDVLLQAGFFVPAIRPPTVAPGASRLRVTLSAAHTQAQVERLAAALGDLAGLPDPSPAAQAKGSARLNDPCGWTRPLRG